MHKSILKCDNMVEDSRSRSYQGDPNFITEDDSCPYMSYALGEFIISVIDADVSVLDPNALADLYNALKIANKKCNLDLPIEELYDDIKKLREAAKKRYSDRVDISSSIHTNIWKWEHKIAGTLNTRR